MITIVIIITIGSIICTISSSTMIHITIAIIITIVITTIIIMITSLIYSYYYNMLYSSKTHPPKKKLGLVVSRMPKL